MLERLSAGVGAVQGADELRSFFGPKERQNPDREVTAVEDGEASSTSHRDHGGDRAQLSDTGRRLAERDGGEPRTDDDRAANVPGGTDARAGEGQVRGDSESNRADAARGTRESEGANDLGGFGLTEEERRRVDELQERDREVRAHEQAHAGVGGPLTGPPMYEYERGPDGRLYAVAGEVSIQLREGRSPEETKLLAELARRAALAPRRPSAQDRRVAAEAARLAANAEKERLEEARETSERRGPEAAEASRNTADTTGADPARSAPQTDAAAPESGSQDARPEDQDGRSGSVSLLA